MFEPVETASTTSGGSLHLPRAADAVCRQVTDHLIGMLGALPEVSVLISKSEASEFDVDRVPRHGEIFALIVPLIETCLEDEPDALSPELAAQLAFMADLPAIPESIALQIAFGRGVGEAGVRNNARLFARARQRGLSIDEYVAELASMNAVPRGTHVRLLHGETRRVPDAERVVRGVALLRRIASLVPLPFRPSLLCTIAWLQWIRGKRAIAAAYLAEASRIEPEHILAYGLSWLVHAKSPAWLRETNRKDGGVRNGSQG